VKTSIRVLAPAFLAACFLGLAGCGADNETEAERLQKAQGAPPPPAAAKGGEAPPQAKNIQDYAAQRQKGMQNEGRSSDYAKSVGGASPASKKK